MTYELAKELKDAGFPQSWPDGRLYFDDNGMVDYACEDHGSQQGVIIPTLSELIEACPKTIREGTFETAYFSLSYHNGTWHAMFDVCDYSPLGGLFAEGSTPEEAVARLWLALKKV